MGVWVIIALFSIFSAVPVRGADFENGQAARLIIGQSSFTDESPTPGPATLGAAGGVAAGGNKLFILDSSRIGAVPVNHRLLIYSDLQSEVPPPVAELPQGSPCPACLGPPDVVIGQPDLNTFNPGVQNGLNTPTAVATDGTHLAVADTNNNRVLIWMNIPTVNNAPPDVVVGQPDFKTTLPATSQKGLRGPEGVWFFNGKLIIADTQNGRVLIYNSIPTSNGAPADIVLGEPDFNTRPSPDLMLTNVKPTASTMISPVTATTAGNMLFVTDLALNRVLIFNTFPTSNNAPADVVVGQPDMSSLAPNNSNANSPLCAVSYKDADGNNVYPQRCAATLSFPRFALSDGTRLFIADGGNDRVLVFNGIPTANGASADVVLGQPDVFQITDSNGAGSLRAPTALAWDGANLYVADPFSRRVLVFTPAELMISAGGVVNAASFAVHAQASITFAGTPKSGDSYSLTITNSAAPVTSTTTTTTSGSTTTTSESPPSSSATYTYTVADGDTIQTIRDNLLSQLNDNPGDPQVYGQADTGPGTYATGGVTFEGDVEPGDQITLQVQDRSYTYVVQNGDDGVAVVYNFIYIINQAQDPDVFPDRYPADTSHLRLTAKVVGEAGNNISYSVSVAGFTTATADGATLTGGASQQKLILVARSGGSQGDNISVTSTPSSGAGFTATLSNPNLTGGNDASQAPPGTEIAIFGKNLAPDTAAADLSQTDLPRELANTQVYVNGIKAPLYFVSPTQINAQVPFEVTGDSISVFVRTQTPDGQVVVSTAKANSAPRAAPGLFAQPGIEPRPGVVVHGQQYATGTVTISLADTSTTASTTLPGGIVVQININGRIYQYTTVDGDTTDTVRDQLVNLINAGPGDPDVTATGGTAGFLSARARVTFGGSVHAGDTVTITINGRDYKYTVQSSDANLTTIANKLINMINLGAGDPDVTAQLVTDVGVNGIDIIARQLGAQGNNITLSVSASSGAQITVSTDTKTGTLQGGSTPSAVILTARKPGREGDNVAYSVFIPGGSAITGATTANNLCCGNDVFSPVTADNPAIPGETIIVFGTGLGLTKPSFSDNQGLQTGSKVPLSPLFTVPLVPSDFVSSLAGGKTATVDFVGLMPQQVGVYQINLTLNSQLPDDLYTPLTIAQGLFVSNVITFPVKNINPTTAPAPTSTTSSALSPARSAAVSTGADSRAPAGSR